MNLLKEKIIGKIKREGPITFETFMEMALYEPDLGYYKSEKTVIGRAGDFYTSQHLHAVFGIMVGKQVEEMSMIMEGLSGTGDFHFVEIGAGEGHMYKDVLDYLKGRECYKSLTYIIVEPNLFMKRRQQTVLGGFRDKVEWVSSLNELDGIRGCIFSNELLDSFPVHMVEMDDQLKEIYVSVENDNILEIKRNSSTAALADYLKEFSIELTRGYRTEINLRIRDWLRSVNEVLLEGFLFTIDYGYPARDYYSEDRSKGTLLCYHKHQVNENPYINIGEQDITAHVNFSSIKKWGEDLRFKTLGYCQQGTFLISLGIDEVIRGLYENSDNYLFEIARVKRLIFPGTIGETHKVMIQYKGEGIPELRGFSIRNQKDKL
ncbi:MAG: SAM-dependent methyltransferase [Nitrospirota bacterium]